MQKANYENHDTILISGHAKFPSTSAARSQFEICTVTIELETKEWKPVSVDCVLITETARNFIEKIIFKNTITDEGLNAIKEQIKKRYFGYAKKTIVSALLDLEINLENAKNLISK